MKQTFKYRLYPTAAQRTRLNQTLELCRVVYNKTLETRKTAWDERSESVSLYDTNKLLPEWKRANPELKQVNAQVLQNVQVRVDLAFQAFFRRVKAGEKPGYPRFRGAGWYDSFSYPQPNNGSVKLLDSGHVRLSKVGVIKIRLHRPLAGALRVVTIQRDRLGNWYACFVCEVEAEPLPPVPDEVGIDLGLKSFAMLSTNQHIANPRFFRKDEKALAKAQRRLSACEKDTPEYRKRQRVVQHIHQRIANRRKDFAHKLSRSLVNDFQIIAFEDLNIQEMQQNGFRSLHKSIADAAWHQLVQYTTYKAESAGRHVVKVDPRNTTQMCSGCGEIVPKDLSVRVHDCPHCGLVIDRDLNAARNIQARGLACLGFDP